MSDNLVFDIGLHNGDDAAYYLHLGYRVVGVEANPLLADRCAQRFAPQVSRGRMTVINAGVLKERGVFTFWRNLTDDGWSSFEPEMGQRGGKWEAMNIPCVTTGQLIAEHGKACYMKVDIEGADLQALQTLSPATAPDYVSLELTGSVGIVENLIELGYSHFKFVDGETYRAAAPIFNHQVGWRMLRKAGRVAPFIKDAVCNLPERFRPARSEWSPAGKHNPGAYPFTQYSSGPFGEQAAGEWMTPKAATGWFNALKAEYRKAGQENALWWDVHARHSSVRTAEVPHLRPNVAAVYHVEW